MDKGHYYLNKDSKTGEILYLEYDKISGYPVTPKTDIRDGIRVNKIVFVSPNLSEKLIKKKIDIKLRNIIKVLDTIEADDDGGSEDGIRITLMEAERLKLSILTKYLKYLDASYGDITIKKLQVLINQLRLKLYDIMSKKVRKNIPRDLYYLDDDEYKYSGKRGRGR